MCLCGLIHREEVPPCEVFWHSALVSAGAGEAPDCESGGVEEIN